MGSLQIIDKSKRKKSDLYQSFFFRSSFNKENVSLRLWVYLCILEIVFGSEILENIVISGAAGSYDGRSDGEVGARRSLYRYIPEGMINNFFLIGLTKLLYFKFHKQYGIFSDNAFPLDIDVSKGEIELTHIRFAVEKQHFSMFIALRRVYELFWIFFNLAVDLLVYFLSGSIEAAFATAMSIEALRRLIRL